VKEEEGEGKRKEETKKTKEGGGTKGYAAPFTDSENKALMLAYATHGNQWEKILNLNLDTLGSRNAKSLERRMGRIQTQQRAAAQPTPISAALESKVERHQLADTYSGFDTCFNGGSSVLPPSNSSSSSDRTPRVPETVVRPPTWGGVKQPTPVPSFTAAADVPKRTRSSHSSIASLELKPFPIGTRVKAPFDDKQVEAVVVGHSATHHMSIFDVAGLLQLERYPIQENRWSWTVSPFDVEKTRHPMVPAAEFVRGRPKTNVSSTSSTKTTNIKKEVNCFVCRFLLSVKAYVRTCPAFTRSIS
jgi:hypothetical protein